ncbi:MAG: hypothetical protein RLZ62_860 [Bacteroidota bacterium]|jgi:hypothetical protein
MNEKQYLTERVDDQINWLEKKSASCKKMFIYIRTIELICSASIPFFVAIMPDTKGVDYTFMSYKWLIGILGMLTAILAGIQALNKYQEFWSQYRTIAESLKSEKILFLTKTGQYSNNDESFQFFVINVENILSKENEKWQRHIEKISLVGKHENS